MDECMLCERESNVLVEDVCGRCWKRYALEYMTDGLDGLARWAKEKAYRAALIKHAKGLQSETNIEKVGS